MKTFNKKDVFSWSNVHDARQYISQYGYFSDYCIENAEEWNYGKLTQIYLDNAVNETFCRDDGYSYGLFIPACKVTDVKNVEKKWRPFKNCEELCRHIKVTGCAGLVFNIRYKGSTHTVQVLITELDLKSTHIGLGCRVSDMKELFQNYEWQDPDSGEWYPFGVEVEE